MSASECQKSSNGLLEITDVPFHVQFYRVKVQIINFKADLFLYSYEADFKQELLKKNKKKLARSFNFTFCYIYDVLSLNNYRFGDFVDRIYHIELEIKDTTDIDRSASYLDLLLEIDSEGRLRTKLYNKRMISIYPL